MERMNRFEDWEQRLNVFLQNIKPFEWGVNDCCLFAANAVNEMTGVDLASKYRGYKTELGAAKKLKDLGVEGVWSKALGDPINWKLLKRGDVVLYENDGNPLVGICIGSKFVAVQKDGATYLPMKLAKKGWSI